ncbi:undecaprenyl-phosphate glucose phosphotransferase [Rhizobium sp. L1K21]|uniref:undecaprenyl-phosphate glucose phosphotransferase n=1 Tax=Rhizobium sp. L1K21 TaxID=2954933 RepID=UPI0020928DBC|nr:undecaprenyl-phosphate glucose phosphotransferase [Rhizobium sp. L1K21]MCO6185839.1 undecaprenyl-phosphate glucose phosphotransferase [Rhizobium sp. L1K21]
MNQLGQQEQFDIEKLRNKVSQLQSAAPGVGDKHAELSPLARQIAEQFAEESFSPSMIAGTVRLIDIASFALIGHVIVRLYLVPEWSQFIPYTALILAAALINTLMMQFADCYQMPILRSVSRGLRRAILTWALTFIGIAGAILALNQNAEFHPVVLASWFAGVLGYLLISRTVLAFSLRKWGRNGIMERRAVIVGGGEPAKALIRSLEAQPDNDIRICGIFDDRNSKRSPDLIAGYLKLGTFDELIEFARLARIDMMIISLPLTAENRIMDLMKRLWVLPVDVRIAAHANKLRFRPRAYSHVGKVPMLDIFDKPIADWDSVAKRAFDIFFASLAIFLLWPVMLVCAIAVKATSKGPALFVQKRHGFNNEEINVYKFRSMYTDMSDPSAKQAVTKNDPRVTRVGRFLRKSSLDELPQFFNVLKGDLSLVGPRPHAVAAQTADLKYVNVVESYFARHKVKPGVTGWAQINGWRGEIDSDEKIKFRTAYDLYYIENWSLWLDLKILFLTPIRLLNSENAY